MLRLLARRVGRSVSSWAPVAVLMVIFALLAGSCTTAGRGGDRDEDLPEFFKQRPNAEQLPSCGSRDYITPYAMTNPEEDFAETVTEYVTDTIALVATAAQNAADGCPRLLWKVHIIMGGVFTSRENGETLTYAYSNDRVYRIPADEAADFFESHTFGSAPELSETNLRMLFEERFAEYAAPELPSPGTPVAPIPTPMP